MDKKYLNYYFDTIYIQSLIKPTGNFYESGGVKEMFNDFTDIWKYFQS